MAPLGNQLNSLRPVEDALDLLVVLLLGIFPDEALASALLARLTGLSEMPGSGR